MTKDLPCRTPCCGPGLRPSESRCPTTELIPAKRGVLQPRCSACFKAHLQAVRKQNKTNKRLKAVKATHGIWKDLPPEEE